MEERLSGRLVSETLVSVGREHASLAGATGRWKVRLKGRLAVVLLVASDALLASLVWVAAYALQKVWGAGALSGVAVAAAASSVLAWIGLRAMLGLYPGYGLDWVETLRRHAHSVFAIAALTALFAVAFQAGDLLSRLLLLVGFVGLLLLGPLVQYLTKLCAKKLGIWGKPVVVVGSEASDAEVAGLLREKWGLGYDPVAIYRYSASRDAQPGSRVLADAMSSIANLARDRGIETIIFATPRTRREQVARLVYWAGRSFRRVIVIPNLCGITNSAVVARDLAGTFGVEIVQNLLDPWARRLKRCLDLCGVLGGGLLLAPVLLCLALCVRLDSRGPVFFGQRRLGADGRHFRCWKFRTMHENAEQLLDRHLQENPYLKAEWESHHKLRDDPRVTRVGRVLRKTSLDELPQLWNVLVGEMSLVGPRPIVDAEVSKYGDFYGLYERIKPGMSGFWQVSGRSDTSYPERVAMDAYYVRNWSMWLDLIILVRTVATVVFGRGAR